MNREPTTMYFLKFMTSAAELQLALPPLAFYCVVCCPPPPPPIVGWFQSSCLPDDAESATWEQ